jgi:hypothetical protein
VKQIRSKIKYSTLLMLMLTLHILMHSLLLPRSESAAFQERTACEASSMADDNDNQAREGNCKPPKHSFIDYSTYFTPKSFLPSYNPNVTVFLPHEPFREHPLVYLEINVPPDNLA